MSTSEITDNHGEVSTEWRAEMLAAPPGGPDFARMIEALRQVLERVAETRPPDEKVSAVAAQFEQLERLLAPHCVEPAARIVGTRWDLPGRGQYLIPPIVLTQANAHSVSGLTTFGPQYHGSGGAVNGGFLSLVFNELMGKLAQTGGRSYARTAFLHVNYRAVASIGSQLRVEATVQREEGRKRFLGGTLHDGTTLVADAEALFVAMK